MKTVAKVVVLGIVVSACGTYYDPNDPYLRGLRWHDRGAYQLAHEYWEPLANNGDCDAQYRLGLLYFLGSGVELDVQKAISLWTSAAERGQPRAQWSLGDIYFFSPEDTRLSCGFGCENVEKDFVTAYKWYLIAGTRAYYGHDKEYISAVLPKIEAKLSSEQKTEGEELASEWRPNPDDCEPRELL